MKRESWASSIGVVLAVAGSAVGLGNFMRFPGLLARNGGGAFLIPYFIALLVVGLPLAWLEWTIGRYGGAHGTGAPPGVFNVVFRKPWAKYVSSISILAILFIMFYYVYLESILLGYAWYSITGALPSMAAAGQAGDFFGSYITFNLKVFGIPANVFFFVTTMFVNVAVIAMGVVKGIERMAKILMPALLIMGIILVVRVFTLPGMEKGLAFMWNPDFSKITQPAVWVDAAGQIFFTLSLGMGCIINYASYVKRDKDITLAALTANATNEFAEIILGGMIIIPTAAAVLGVTQLTQVAQGGTFGLSFLTMPTMLAQLPFSQFFSLVWFMLLFFAGVTSTLSMFQPARTFFHEDLRMSKTGALIVVSILVGAMSTFVMMDANLDVLGEIDFWGGSFFLLLFGFIESFLFATHIDTHKGWLELHRGGHITIPKVYRFVLKYITPTFLGAILIGWIVMNGYGYLTNPKTPSIVYTTRFILVGIAVCINLLIAYAWRRHKVDEHQLSIKVEDSLHD